MVSEQKHGVYKETYFYAKDNYKSSTTYMKLWYRGKLIRELSYKCDPRVNSLLICQKYCDILPFEYTKSRIIYRFKSISDVFKYFNETKKLVEQYGL